MNRNYAVFFVLKTLKNGCCYVFKFCGTCEGEISKIFWQRNFKKEVT